MPDLINVKQHILLSLMLCQGSYGLGGGKWGTQCSEFPTSVCSGDSQQPGLLLSYSRLLGVYFKGIVL